MVDNIAEFKLEDGSFSSVKKIFEGRITIKDNKPCSEIALVKGIAKVNFAREISQIKLSIPEDLDKKYSTKEGKTIFLDRNLNASQTVINGVSYTSEQIEYILKYESDAVASLDLFDATQKKIPVSGESSSSINNSRTLSYNFSQDPSPKKAVIEFPLKMEEKTIPFTFNLTNKTFQINKEDQDKFDKYMQMVKKGDAKAQYVLAYIYSKGEIVEKDINKV